MDELSNLFGGAEQLWQYIKIYAAKAGREATRVVLELYYVVKSPIQVLCLNFLSFFDVELNEFFVYFGY